MKKSIAPTWASLEGRWGGISSPEMPCPQSTLGHFLGICYIQMKFERTVYVCQSSLLRVTLQEKWTVEVTVHDKRPGCGRTRTGVSAVWWKGVFLPARTSRVQPTGATTLLLHSNVPALRDAGCPLVTCSQNKPELGCWRISFWSCSSVDPASSWCL